MLLLLHGRLTNHIHWSRALLIFGYSENDDYQLAMLEVVVVDEAN